MAFAIGSIGSIGAQAQAQPQPLEDVALYRFSAPTAVYNQSAMTPFSHSVEMYEYLGYGNASEYWRVLLSSPHMARPRSTQVRAIDMFEHIRIQFRSPLGEKLLWYKNTTTPKKEDSGGVADSAAFPRYLKDGDLKGANVFEDPRTIAMDDDAMYWLCEDGTLRYYRRNGYENTSYSPATWTHFSDGPFKGEALADMVRHLIGVEGRIMRFMVNDVDVIHYQMQKNKASYTQTTSWKFTVDPLKGRTLGEVLNRQVAGFSYLGWDRVGPVIASFEISGNAAANIPGIGDVMVTPGARDEFPPTHHTGIIRVPGGGQALDADGNPITDLAGDPIPDGSLIAPDGGIVILPDGSLAEIDDGGVITMPPGAIVIRPAPAPDGNGSDGGREEIHFPHGGEYDALSGDISGGIVKENIIEPVRITSIKLVAEDTPAIRWMAPTNSGAIIGHIIYAKTELAAPEWTPLRSGFILDPDGAGATLPATLGGEEEPFHFFKKATIIRQ